MSTAGCRREREQRRRRASRQRRAGRRYHPITRVSELRVLPADRAFAAFGLAERVAPIAGRWLGYACRERDIAAQQAPLSSFGQQPFAATRAERDEQHAADADVEP